MKTKRVPVDMAIAALPNHKMKFKTKTPGSPSYRRMHATWKVDGKKDC